MIKISNLIFKYKTNAFTIKVDNFYVDRGKIILIKGYNGSGKTTFLKILAGILKPQNGEIYIGDKKIQNYSDNLYTRIGYLRQQPESFISVRVKELVVMGVYPYHMSLLNIPFNILKRCVNVLKKLNIYQFKNKKICELSAGQLQLCFLGKLLFQDPAIFLLDEPFNNLDENYTTLIIDIIKKLKDKGKIIIIATHRHSYYQINFDMRYEFSNGKLALVDDSNI